MAGVRKKKLPSGKWNGWYYDMDRKRKSYTGTRTLSRSEVLKFVEKLEFRHEQIRQGLQPRPDQQQALARPIGEVRDEYRAWCRAKGGRDGRPQAPQHVQKVTQQLRWWQERLHLKTLSDWKERRAYAEMVKVINGSNKSAAAHGAGASTTWTPSPRRSIGRSGSAGGLGAGVTIQIAELPGRTVAQRAGGSCACASRGLFVCALSAL